MLLTVRLSRPWCPADAEEPDYDSEERRRRLAGQECLPQLHPMHLVADRLSAACLSTAQHTRNASFIVSAQPHSWLTAAII